MRILAAVAVSFVGFLPLSASTEADAGLDPARMAAALRASGAVAIDVPGDVVLRGTWTLPRGSITIRAGGSVIAEDWQLTSSGSSLTLAAPAVHLRGRTRLDVSQPGGVGGNVALVGPRGHGLVEIAADASVDASGTAGQGGRILLAAGDVRARGSLLALGRGRIDVEAGDALQFLSRANTGGGVIRLDPTNLRIGNFAGTDSNVTAGTDKSPNNPPANGQVDAGNLAVLLATNSVIVHTTAAAGPGTGLQGAFTGDVSDGDIAVEEPVVWNSAFSLTLLAHDDLIVKASVQNGGSGSVVGVSGWDGATTLGFTGTSVAPSAYGAAGGSTYIVGTSLPDMNVAFGSRDGTTAIWAFALTVQGSTHPDQTRDGFAMVGFRIADGTSATGAIQVMTHSHIFVLPGETTQSTVRFAQIGHGGELWSARTGTAQGNLSGAITVTAEGDLVMDDGDFTNYAQIGHGGLEFDSVSRGNLGGDIAVSAVIMLLTADTSGGAQIGHGGNVDKITTEGDIDGAISIDASQLTMTSGVTLVGGAKIGHGGSAVTAINPPPARIPPVVGDIGSLTAGGAPIIVTVANGITLNNIATAARTGVSQIGHGGQILFGGTFGTIAGNVTVVAGGAIVLSSGNNCNNYCGSQIGHSAAQLTVFNSFVDAVQGDISVTAGTTLSVTGGGATAGGGQLQFAQIGHGGPLVGAQDSFGIAGTTSWAGTPAVAGDTNDVTVLAQSVTVQGGIGALAYAQIGNGGLLSSNDNTFSHVIAGPLDGNVNVTASTGNLQLAAGADPNGGASAQIGNGGWNGSPPGVTTVTESGASGSISVDVAVESSLVDDAGGSKWWLGHRTAATLTNAPVLFDTGTLDFTSGPGATNATISDPAFWNRFVADPAPAGPETSNAEGGSVTLRAHGPAGTDGNLNSDQPLTIPGGITNPVTVLSTDDLTFNSPVTNSGSSLVDLVADDANPNPPGMSATALLTIGAAGTPTGQVRLFAVRPSQFFKPITYTPAEQYGVWYQTFGSPIVGVNYKASADPTLTTQASPGITVGGMISDSATLAGGSSPTGSITFDLYGPDDAACSGAIAFTATVAVFGNGLYPSGSFAPPQAGTYRWVASYSGDSSNNAAASPCNAANESVVVSQAAPTLTTQASAGVTLGNGISDSATLAGGVSATGTITFDLYGPDDAACSGAVIFTASIPVAGNGVYASGSFTPSQLGTYRWTASYSGDANNTTASSPCNAANESVVVSQATPTLTTQASAPTTLGGSVSDAATLAGGANPTGTITFDLYGPDDAACSGAIVFTDTVPVAGNGVYATGTFTPVLAGTYRWVAGYSGDASNAAVASPCNAPNESVVVGQVIPTLTTQASASVTLGGSVSDSATLAGGATPTGTISFNLYGPNDASCSGAPAFADTVPVAGNGVYTSGSFTPAQVGTYRWTAAYSGDVNNGPVTSPCNAPNESVDVNPAGVSVSATKTASPGPYVPGGTVTYTITIVNTGAGTQQDNPGDEFIDVLPPTLALVTASATSGTAVATVATNTATWNGVIPPAGTVTITITAMILPAAAGTTVSNQGTVNFDGDGNGTNESAAQTDDPNVAGAANPTDITVAAIGAIPALSPLALMLLCACMAAIAIMRVR
jgi:uncharacterized repeat protein (TIGR01451 family)